jgi:hypothetical protein
MITIRPSNERGNAYFGWLDSKHTFSFGQYYDPGYMGFSSLRVINEDKVSPSQGFATHSHSDMEIISYVLDGELKHQDSIGNGSVIRPGDVQRMTAGTGISHSEYNASPTNPVHFLQIWILPEKKGLTPSYEQKYFSPEDKQGKLKLVGSQDGRDNSVVIHQDVNLYVACLQENETVEYSMPIRRNIWIQVARGEIEVNGQPLSTGDGAGVVLEEKITIASKTDRTEFLLFDLA